MGNATSMFQSDAQPGGRVWNRRGYYVPVPAAAVPHATAGGTCEHAEFADPGVLPEFAEHDDEARRGSGGGGHAILCRVVGYGAASGGDARICGYVSGDGDCVSAGAAVPADHETAEAPSGRGSYALGSHDRKIWKTLPYGRGSDGCRETHELCFRLVHLVKGRLTGLSQS